MMSGRSPAATRQSQLFDVHVSHHPDLGVIQDVAVIHPHAWAFIEMDRKTDRRLDRDVHGVLPLRDALVIQDLEEIAMQVKRVIERRVVRHRPDVRLSDARV
jgi:hypothetical protein